MNSKKQSSINNKKNRPWGGLGFSLFWLTTLAGLLYVVFQWYQFKNVVDPYFVGIIMGNTYAIYRFTLFLKYRINLAVRDFAIALKHSETVFEPEQVSQNIFDIKTCFISGLVYGFIFFFGVLLLSPWDKYENLNYLLAAFLFMANVLTGMSLSSLFKYFKHSIVIGLNINVELWDRAESGVSTLTDLNRIVVLAVAFGGSAGMISILFSIFTLDFSVLLFSIFNITLILIAYSVPLIPITAKIRAKRKQNLNELDRLIQKEYESIVNNQFEFTKDRTSERFHQLVQVHSQVKSVRAFPPVGEQSVGAALSVVLLTLLPSIIDFVLKRLVA